MFSILLIVMEEDNKDSIVKIEILFAVTILLWAVSYFLSNISSILQLYYLVTDSIVVNAQSRRCKSARNVTYYLSRSKTYFQQF